MGEFGKKNYYTKMILSYDHFRPQYELVEIAGRIEVDILMTFENIESDVKILAKRI